MFNCGERRERAGKLRLIYTLGCEEFFDAGANV